MGTTISAKEKLEVLNQTLKLTERISITSGENEYQDNVSSLSETQITEVITEIENTLPQHEGPELDKFYYILNLLQLTIPVSKEINNEVMLIQEHPVRGLKREAIVNLLLDTAKSMATEAQAK